MPVSLISMAIAAIVAIQTAPAPTPSPGPASAKPAPSPTPALMMTGCITQEAGEPAKYTFADPATGTKYRLSGISVKKYAGQRVLIIGRSPAGGLAIRGGLVPSPNAAAQAGALDPARAAVAQAPGGTASGTGVVELPDFRVARAQLLGGSCH